MTSAATDYFAPLLREFLPAQRWFAGRGRTVVEVRTGQPVRLNDGLPALVDVLATVTYADGGVERYQVPLGLGDPAPVEALGTVLLDGQLVAAWDALADPHLCMLWLERIAGQAELGGLRFRSVAGDLDARACRRLVAEQSNTSVVYDERLILKLYRRLEPGMNPDLEVTRALAGKGFTSIAAPLGWVEDCDTGSTLAVLQPFYAGSSEGWQLALERSGAWQAGDAGAGFDEQASALGTVTAELHLALADVLPTATSSDAAALSARRERELEETLTLAPALAPLAGALRAVFAGAGAGAAHVQRIHGDYHLGQVLRTDSSAGSAGGWIVLDFEGEPARPIEERKRLDSPLRDVAGMLRSFDYAAFHPLVGRAVDPVAKDLVAEARALQWAGHARTAFLEGYFGVVAPDDWSAAEPAPALRAWELDKALYEVRYEARYRPDWLPIPLGAVVRLATGA